MTAFVENQKALVVRGLAGIGFSLLAFFMPFVTIAGLVLMFGAYVFLDGVLALGAALHPRRNRRHALLLLEGMTGIGVGIASLVWTGATVLVLTSLLAIWALITGGLELAMAFHLERGFPGRLQLFTVGIMSLVFGATVIVFPAAGALGIVFLFGAYAMAFGVTMLVLAWRLRQHTKRSADHAPGRFAARSA